MAKIHQKIQIKFRNHSNNPKNKERENRRTENRRDGQKTSDNMIDSNSTILIIVLNDNGLNSPTTKQKLSELAKMHDSTMCCQ